MMREIGFSDVEYKNLTGGIAAIHFGTKEKLDERIGTKRAFF